MAATGTMMSQGVPAVIGGLIGLRFSRGPAASWPIALLIYGVPLSTYCGVCILHGVKVKEAYVQAYAKAMPENSDGKIFEN